MLIKNVKRLPQEVLIQKLRAVPLRENPSVLEYKNAALEIKMANPGEFQPGAFYVLKDQLKVMAEVMDALAEELGGFDKLDTLIEFQDETDSTRIIAPPIIELADFGKWMILDGLHRCFIARQRGIEIPLIFASELTRPYYCLPLPKGWDSVKIRNEVPKRKRVLRPGVNDTPETRYSLHKDLSELGSSGTRQPGSK